VELATIVPVMHAIVLDEFYPGQKQFPLISSEKDETAADSVVCDYCGSDIFIGFFECVGCRGTAEDGVVEDIQMCPGCVAEGRTCGCKEPMTAMQRFPFSAVLENYNRAVRVLKSVGKGAKFEEIREDEDPFYLEDRDVGLFKAAVMVTGWACRKEDKIHKCGTRASGEQHLVLEYETLRCGGCHFSMCFKHWAERGAHSSEIVPVRVRDDKINKRWHLRHKALRPVVKESRRWISEAEESGGPIEPAAFPIKLARLACAYPYGQAHKRSLLSGFYDYIATI